jgi:hypothetical protein
MTNHYGNIIYAEEYQDRGRTMLIKAVLSGERTFFMLDAVNTHNCLICFLLSNYPGHERDVKT